MYEITKAFEFCYGHRVWTQRLHPFLSEGAACACRHLHGHQATVHVSLRSPSLENNMVTDFKNLAFLKTWIDQNLDHRLLLDEKDPLLSLFLMGQKLGPVHMGEQIVAKAPVLVGTEQGPEREMLEGLTVLPCCPTSENLARWLYDALAPFLRQTVPNVALSKITWWETPKSCASYSPQ